MNRRRRRASHHFSDSRLRNMLSYFFAFLLSLVFMVQTVLLVLHFGIMSERSFLSNFDEDYIRATMAVIKTETEYYTTPTGIDLSVLEGIFTEDEIAEDIRQLVSAAFSGGEYTPDLSAQNARIENNLRSFFRTNNLKPEEGSIDDVVGEYTADIDEIYTDTVRLPGLEAIAGVRRQFLRYDLKVFGVLCLAALFLAAVCLKLHHYFHRGLRYVAYAAGAAALMSIALPLILYVSKFYVGLNLQPKYFYHFTVSIIVRLLKNMMIGGLFWIGMMLILALIIRTYRAYLMRH